MKEIIENQYLKELESFMRIKVKVNSKISHSRKCNKIFRYCVFGGYERINETEFFINTKIGLN